MDEELLETEEEQQQPEPSKNRFLDAARQNMPISTVHNSPSSGKTNPDQDSKPITPGEQATIDQMEAGLRDNKLAPEPQPKLKQQAAQAQKAASFLSKNKKWFAGGGIGLGVLIPIGLFFFWLMLFKNVHIKNLYVTYRWAQFNRGMNKALGEEIAKAKEAGVNPEGTADTAINESMTPEEMIKNASAEELDIAKINPAEEATRASNVVQTDEIPTLSQETLTEFGAGDRNVPEAKTTEEIGNKMSAEIAEQGEGLKGNSSQLGDAVDESAQLEKSGKSARAAASEATDNYIKGSSTGAAQAIRAATGIGVAATFYCLFRDIYISTKEQINKIVLGGAIATSQELKKTAGCQQRGKCSMEQASAMSAKFDDGIQSFTETCGYSRATQTNNPNCKDINPQYTVNSFAKIANNFIPGGEGGVKAADMVFDPPKAGAVINAGCKAVTSPAGQLMLVALNGAGIVVSGGGWEAVGQAVGSGIVTAAGTAGGKALIAHAILVYRGNLFKDLNPLDMGNLTDMGEKATASITTKKAGGVKIDKATGMRLNKEYREERIAANKKRSVLAKLFDTNSTDSVITRTALSTPTSPNAIVARIGTLFASISNPLKLNKSIGSTTMALGPNSTAMAAFDPTSDPYGIADYAPANIAYNISAKDADSFYNSITDAVKTALELKYQKCNESNDAKANAEDIATTDPGDCTGDDYHKYAAAKFNKTAVYAMVYSHNKQDDSKVGGAVGVTTTPANTDLAKKGLDTSDETKFPCPAGTTRSIGEVHNTSGEVTHKVGLCDIGDGTIVNASAAQAFYNMKADAARSRITLYGGGYRSYEEQKRLRVEHGCANPSLPPGACRPPTARPGESNHEEGLAVDFKNCKRGTPVFAWLQANAKKYGIYNLPSESWHWSVNGG